MACIDSDDKVLRFRMPYFHGDSEDRTASRWHLPAKNYNPKEARAGGYRELVALCGYTLPMRKAWNAQWTSAKSVPKKDQCTKCAAKQNTDQ
jgi:hypothetical protein